MQSEMPGYVSTVRRASRAEITQLTVGTSPSTTRPEGGPPEDWISSRIWSICRTMPAVRASSRRPASVSTMPRPFRVNSSARNSCSSSLIWRLSAGCATRSVSEALLRLPSSATQLKVLSCLISIACQSSKAGPYAITIQHRGPAAVSQRPATSAIDINPHPSPEKPMTAQEQDEFHDIRDAVAKLCAQFPGEYWRKLDRQMAYPKEFVDALTEAGYLSVLIPEEYGGSGLKLSAAAAILEEIQRAGCNGGGCHAQMYTMGTVLRHGNDAQKAKYLPGIASGKLRLQAFGVTEPTSGT